MPKSADLLPGTLDMLILKAVEHAPIHGWGVAEKIDTLSQGVFRLQTGTLCGAALDHTPDGHTSRRAHPVLLHVSGIYIFGIDAEKALIIRKE